MTDRPEHFEGTVTIEWTPDGPSPMRGWRFWISTEDGTPVTTVTDLTVHASADNLVWAELTMFADENGNPAVVTEDGPRITGITLGEDGKPLTATFAFEVAGMGRAGAVTTSPSPLCWDIADEDTRDLIVKMNMHRLIGSRSALPALEACDQVSSIVARALAEALAGAGIRADAASPVRRHFARLLGNASTGTADA